MAALPRCAAGPSLSAPGASGGSVDPIQPLCPLPRSPAVRRAAAAAPPPPAAAAAAAALAPEPASVPVVPPAIWLPELWRLLREDRGTLALCVLCAAFSVACFVAVAPALGAVIDAIGRGTLGTPRELAVRVAALAGVYLGSNLALGAQARAALPGWWRGGGHESAGRAGGWGPLYLGASVPEDPALRLRAPLWGPCRQGQGPPPGQHTNPRGLPASCPPALCPPA